MSARRCNDCTLCCKLMPVAEIGKPAGTVCTQQRSKGCRVYNSPSYPRACRLWSCLWLLDDSLSTQRPDYARYVIDPSPDFVLLEGHPFKVVQIWVDPRFPNAHRDPVLRDWLITRWDTHQQFALVRFNSLDAMALIPPTLTSDGQWLEHRGTRTTERQHSPAEIARRFKEMEGRTVTVVTTEVPDGEIT